MRNYLKKHTDRKGKQLKYDFLPPLQEVIEKPAHTGGTIIIFSIFALILSAVLWAAFMETDVVISVSGTAEPAGELSVVQAHAGGVVESITASPGSLVQEGETLITLRQEVAEIDVQEVIHNISLYSVQQKLYERIYRGNEAMEDIHAEDYGRFSWEAGCIIEEQKIYDNNVRILELQSQDALSEEEAEIQVDNYKLNRKLEIAEKISACATRIREGNAALEKARINMTAGTIPATESGYLTDLAVNTVGQVVSASQIIAYIVPEDADLHLKCYVANQDISQIQMGLPVEIKWNAYPYSRYGTTEGSVSYISPAAVYSEQMGYVYMIKVSFDNADERMEFLPGMSAVVDIRTKKRTVLEYFLDPVRKGLDSSLKEP